MAAVIVLPVSHPMERHKKIIEVADAVSSGLISATRATIVATKTQPKHRPSILRHKSSNQTGVFVFHVDRPSEVKT